MSKLGTAQRAVALAAATAALAGGATFATADAATAAPATGASVATTAFAPPQPGAVLLKETTTAEGVLRFYKLAGPPQAATKVRVGNALVSPHDANGCNGIDPEVCFDVLGQGYYVSLMQNDTQYRASTVADLQIKDPNGTIVAEEREYVNPGWYVADYAPRDYVQGGWWCGFSNGNGGIYTGTCIDVHN